MSICPPAHLPGHPASPFTHVFGIYLAVSTWGVRGAVTQPAAMTQALFCDAVTLLASRCKPLCSSPGRRVCHRAQLTEQTRVPLRTAQRRVGVRAAASFSRVSTGCCVLEHLGMCTCTDVHTHHAIGAPPPHLRHSPQPCPNSRLLTL